MTSIYSQPILLFIVACISTVSSAHRNFWDYNCRYRHKSPPPTLPPPPPPPPPSPSPPPPPKSSRKIIVGGSEHWRLGFDYNDWALKNAPFYINDILAFKYDPPNSTTIPHSVYLLSNIQSFSQCDLRGAKKLANWTQGSGDGFQFVLKFQLRPYYFVCGEANGFHCKNGNMKFSVTPTSPPQF